MKTPSLALVAFLALLSSACSGGGASSGGSRGSFDVEISGAMERQESGASAIVYDMAGFTHIGMHADDGSFQIDFNTKGTERPAAGVLELQRSNLRGWMVTVDVREDSGMTTYSGTGGTLEITSVDGSEYTGTFAFQANQEGDASAQIDVSGSFEAREKE